MKDAQGTTKHLLDEIATLHQRVAELEASELERKRAEAAHRDSEERYRILYEDNPSMYFTLDIDGTVLSVNQFGAEQLGYTAAGLIGQSVLHVFHQDDREAVLQQLAECVQNPGVVSHWEFRKVRKNGSLMWVREAARAVRSTDGRMVVLIVCEDITERKQAEEALQRAHDELERRVAERTAELSDAIESLRDQIAQRRKAEGALHESLENFRLLLETTHAIPWEADALTWQFTYVGPQAVTLLGYPLDRWYDKDFWMMHIHPEDRDYATDFCLTASLDRENFEFEYRMLSSKGEVVWLHDIVNVVKEDGKPRTLRGFMVDITERKRAEEALRKNEERFRQVLEAAPDGMVLVRQEGTIAFVNEQSERLFGYTRDELVGRPVEILIPDRFRQVHTQHRTGYGNQPRIRPMGSGLALYARRKDGSEFPVEISLSPVETPEGVLISSAVRDITERTHAEEALRESEEKYRLVAETANDAIITIDDSSRIVYVNPATEKIFGYAVEELLGQSLTVLMPDSLRSRHGSALKKFVETGQRSVSWEGIELTGLHRSGREVPIEVSFGAIRQARGTYLFTGIVRDISKRKRTEEMLEKQRAFLRQVIDISPNFIFAKDRKGRFTLVNQAVANAYGTTVEGLIGKTDADFNPNVEEVESFRQMDLEVMDTLQEKLIPEEHITDAQGKVRWLQTVKRPIISEDGTANQVLGSATDITERKRVEQALRASEAAIRESRKALQDLAGKLLTAQEAERRRLAREMHDDLTQRLAVLAIEAGKLEGQLQSVGGGVSEKLRQMKEHVVKLAADVHAISRRLHPSILDDLGLVDAMEAECTSFSQREGILVTYEPTNVPTSLSKEVALCLYRVTQEALRNIAKHAHAPKAHVSLIGRDGGIILRIQDHGIGFTPGKGRGKMGLGLASMKERARLIQAELSVNSRPGEGTVIEVWAPLQGE